MPSRNSTLEIVVCEPLLVCRGALQVAGGALLLIGRFVPLGMALLGPMIVNILCFHVFLGQSGLPLAIVISLLALLLLWSYRASFAGLCRS